MAPSVPLGDPTPASLLIPRTFHRIWLGGAMPAEYERYGATWLAHHPDWEMVTWTEDTLPPLRNQAAFDAATSLAQKADIARYELLLRFGGVYVDTDFECLRNIEPLLAGLEAFSAREDDEFVAIGIMGAVAGHPVFAAAVEQIPGRIAAMPHSGPNEQTGPHLLTELVRAHGDGTTKLTVFGPREFYPYSYDEPHRRGEAFPEAYAVHHWAHSWAEPQVHRFALPVDMARPGDAAVPMALYGELFGVEDPVELALVIDGELTPDVGEQLGALATAVGLATGPAVVAYAPEEVAALPLAGVLGPDPAGAARAVARMLALREDLSGGIADAPTALVDTDLQDDFRRLYRDATWTDGIPGMPLSGGGSLPAVSRPVIDFIREQVGAGSVRSIVDIGCGDLAYMTEVPEVVSGAVDYCGYDIVPELVEAHRCLAWGEFQVGDVTTPGFRADADLVVLKDVLFHLSNEQALAALRNLAASSWKWLVITSNDNDSNEPRVFDRYRWAALNLTLSPFSLEPVAALPRDGGGHFLVFEPSALERLRDDRGSAPVAQAAIAA
jgi:hypothetical protein